MATLPPPPPIDGAPNSSTSTTLLTNKERKALLAAVKLKEINLNRIKEANKNLNSFDPNRTMFTFHSFVLVTSSNKTFTIGI